MNDSSDRYSYELDKDGNSTAAKVVRIVGNKKTVLEVGCASGSQTRLFASNECLVTAIEISASYAELARPFCHELHLGNIESIDLHGILGESKFDVVVFADVLEHLREPAQALRKVKPFLRPEGYVVASIPNVTHAALVYELMHGRFDYRPTGLLDDTHIRFFSKISMLKMFEEAGYLVESLDRTFMTPRETEFRTTPVLPEDQHALDYLIAKNPESRTYQFIVKARVASDENIRIGYGAQAAQDRIVELERVVSRLQMELAKLADQTKWLTSRPSYRFLSNIRKALKRIVR